MKLRSNAFEIPPPDESGFEMPYRIRQQRIQPQNTLYNLLSELKEKDDALLHFPIMEGSSSKEILFK